MGSEWLSAKKSREAGLFEGLVFSLGWWGKETDVAGVEGDTTADSGTQDVPGRARRFGIGVGRAEWG